MRQWIERLHRPGGLVDNRGSRIRVVLAAATPQGLELDRVVSELRGQLGWGQRLLGKQHEGGGVVAGIAISLDEADIVVATGVDEKVVLIVGRHQRERVVLDHSSRDQGNLRNLAYRHLVGRGRGGGS